jgi:hypothetical protein
MPAPYDPYSGGAGRGVYGAFSAPSAPGSPATPGPRPAAATNSPAGAPRRRGPWVAALGLVLVIAVSAFGWRSRETLRYRAAGITRSVSAKLAELAAPRGPDLPHYSATKRPTGRKTQGSAAAAPAASPASAPPAGAEVADSLPPQPGVVRVRISPSARASNIIPVTIAGPAAASAPPSAPPASAPKNP